jgi:hypothetical protein
MSAPIALVKASAYSSPPTNNTEYGKGSFLVGFFGEAIKYSLDGQIWYEHPKHYDWSKGNYAELDDVTANDNDKTIDFTSTPIFISHIILSYISTNNGGTRSIRLIVEGTDNAKNLDSLYLTANKYLLIHFEPTDDSSLAFDDWNYHIVFPKFWDSNLPFWNKITFGDKGDIDDNDDITIFIRGCYALPKYHWIKFKNCKNFQVEKVVESLGDGVFSGTKPHSLKILKI